MASLEPLVGVAHLVARAIVVHQDQEEMQEALVQWDRLVEQDLLDHWERLVRLVLLVLAVEEASRGRSAQLVPQEFQAVLVCLGPQELLEQQDQRELKVLLARLGPQEPVEVRVLVVAQGRSVQLVRRVLSVPLDLPEQLEQEVLPGQLEALEQQVLLGLLGPQVPQDQLEGQGKLDAQDCPVIQGQLDLRAKQAAQVTPARMVVLEPQGQWEPRVLGALQVPLGCQDPLGPMDKADVRVWLGQQEPRANLVEEGALAARDEQELLEGPEQRVVQVPPG